MDNVRDIAKRSVNGDNFGQLVAEFHEARFADKPDSDYSLDLVVAMADLLTYLLENPAALEEARRYCTDVC
ncbi:hypothetical protein KGP36_07260 [Patescibacteria group bacterium]|nr:hypothetical protein [Patescibacteria group bacterium]